MTKAQIKKRLIGSFKSPMPIDSQLERFLELEPNVFFARAKYFPGRLEMPVIDDMNKGIYYCLAKNNRRLVQQYYKVFKKGSGRNDR